MTQSAPQAAFDDGRTAPEVSCFWPPLRRGEGYAHWPARRRRAGDRCGAPEAKEALLRVGLVKVLEAAGFEIVAEVGDADALLAAVARHQPDLAVVDVRMPPGLTDDGIRAALVIRRQWPAAKLDLTAAGGDHRRVLAILRYLAAMRS
jgi:CheY-like chemotaxis protein